MPRYDPEKLKAFWEYVDALKGWANLALAGNAVALGYCLTVLNSDSPRYNVGAFIVIFGIGVLLGAIFYLVLMLTKADVTTAIVTQTRPGSSLRGTAIEWAGYAGMFGSPAAFALGVILFIFRFWIL